MKRFFAGAVRSFPFWYIVLLWIIEIVEQVQQLNFSWLGVHPRHWGEWYGIITGALIHSDFEHLINNTYPLAICGLFIIFLLEKYSTVAFICSYLLSGLLIFLFARSETYHIGASGVAYSWAFLLAASGFFRKDRTSLGLGLIVAFLYGSMVWGIFPLQPGVSWDGHLYGAVAGILVAFWFRNVNRSKEPTEQVEPEEEMEENHYVFDQYNYGNFEYIRRQSKEEE